MADDISAGLAMLRQMHATIQEHADELTRLDAAIGDGDHGTNMLRGFEAVLPAVEAQADQSLGALLKTAATTLISTVGGASGPLFGTAFLRAATALQGVDPVDDRAVLAAFASTVEGVRSRGKAVPGEKTMIDALEPAADALRIAIEDGEDLATAFSRAATAAKTGMEATIAMQAAKGRASYLGERSIGHQDPGATSSCLLVQAIADTLRERSG